MVQASACAYYITYSIYIGFILSTDNCANVIEILNNQDINIFPNPVNDIVNIDLTKLNNKTNYTETK